MDNVPPHVASILKKYPDVSPGSLEFPPDSETWTEKEIHAFVFSMGFIKPKRPSKPTESEKPAVEAQAVSLTSGDPSTATTSPTDLSSAPGDAISAQQDEAAAVEVPKEARSLASVNIADDQESVATPLAEVNLMKLEGNSTHVPLVTFMEDVGPNGFRLSAAALKCERSRTATLMRCAQYDLSVLKDRFGVGLLLREYAVEQHSPAPSSIMSVLWCTTTVELPCPPFIVLRQHLRGRVGEAPIFTLLCVMLVLNLQTMSPLDNVALYEQVATPLREALQLKKPSGQEGVPKFLRSYPKRGAPFRPEKVLKGIAIVMPSDCDMYRVIFHPQMPDVCQRVNFRLGVDFAEAPEVAFYGNMAQPAKVGDTFDVFVFVQVEPQDGDKAKLQHRVLYLFVRRGTVPGAADACAMSAFMVYGQTSGCLASEDVAACAVPSMRKLQQFAAASGAAYQTAEVDLTRCKRGG